MFKLVATRPAQADFLVWLASVWDSLTDEQLVAMRELIEAPEPEPEPVSPPVRSKTLGLSSTDPSQPLPLAIFKCPECNRVHDLMDVMEPGAFCWCDCGVVYELVEWKWHGGLGPAPIASVSFKRRPLLFSKA